MLSRAVLGTLAICVLAGCARVSDADRERISRLAQHYVMPNLVDLPHESQGDWEIPLDTTDSQVGSAFSRLAETEAQAHRSVDSISEQPSLGPLKSELHAYIRDAGYHQRLLYRLVRAAACLSWPTKTAGVRRSLPLARRLLREIDSTRLRRDQHAMAFNDHARSLGIADSLHYRFPPASREFVVKEFLTFLTPEEQVLLLNPD